MDPSQNLSQDKGKDEWVRSMSSLPLIAEPFLENRSNQIINGDIIVGQNGRRVFVKACPQLLRWDRKGHGAACRFPFSRPRKKASRSMGCLQAITINVLIPTFL